MNTASPSTAPACLESTSANFRSLRDDQSVRHREPSVNAIGADPRQQETSSGYEPLRQKT
jgi:hypothetical protein